MLKCILGCGSKGRCFRGGGALLRPEMENREEDEEDGRWGSSSGRIKCLRLHGATGGVVTGVGGAGVARGWLAGPRKQRLNL